MKNQLKILCLALLISFGLIFTFFKRINDQAMLPILRKGDWVLVSPFTKQYQIGDLIIIRDPLEQDQILVRRIIGRFNDNILFNSNGTLYISDHVVEQKELAHDEKYRYIEEILHKEDQQIHWRIAKKIIPTQESAKKFKIPTKKIFVLADNRDESLDSRYWGTLDQNKILGIILLRIGPSDPWQNAISFF
jgi:signal peptidase I